MKFISKNAHQRKHPPEEHEVAVIRILTPNLSHGGVGKSGAGPGVDTFHPRKERPSPNRPRRKPVEIFAFFYATGPH
jgi:hypothetical protein